VRSMIRNTEMSYVRLEMSFPPIPAISLVAAFDPFLPLAAPAAKRPCQPLPGSSAEPVSGRSFRPLPMAAFDPLQH
jgi:hypothetical protein